MSSNRWFIDDPNTERDGCCKTTPVGPRLCWMTPSAFSEALQQHNKPLVLDMRSFSSFNLKHVKTAHSLCFSPILVRRMLKNFMSLDSLVTDHELFSAIEAASTVVVYDTSSKPGTVKQELVKFAEMLNARFPSISLRILLGGMANFEDKFPNLCTSSKAQSPINVTLDMSKIERKERSNATPECNPVDILPWLYLGSAKDSADVESLRRMGITAVLNITTTCPNFFESEFEYMSILVEDSPQTDLHSRLQQAIGFIDGVKNKGGRVFVHCHAGISRSATVCIAYVMQYKRISSQEAYSFVKSRRPIISPNLSFMGQLIQYEQDLATTTSIWTAASNTQQSFGDIDTTTTNTSTTITDILTHKSNESSLSSTTTVVTSSSQEPPHLTLQYHAQESKKVSQLNDMLPHITRPSSNRRLPPLFSTSERSFSVPVNVVRNTSKRRREELRLSLDMHNPARKSPQLSPCRVEVTTLDGKMTASLTLSTTCT